MNIPEWLEPYRAAYESYLEMRKKKKWVLTARAETMLLNKLHVALLEGYDIEHMLDEASERNWRSVFVSADTPKRYIPQEEHQPSAKIMEIKQRLDAYYANKSKKIS